MTEQPAAAVTPADVERIVRRDYGTERSAEALAMLAEYGAEDWHREPDRVRAACLKLAAGSLEQLRIQVQAAKCDYRDVLGPAEYPEYQRRMFHFDQLPHEERQRILDADWRHYQDWFHKT